MADFLEVNNLLLRTRIGFNAHEIDKLQDILITIKIFTDTSNVVVNDDPVNCVDIKAIIKTIIKTVEEKTYNLIETIANDVAYITLLVNDVKSVEVNVKKPNAIRFSDFSAITINRKLSDFTFYNVAISIGSNIDPYSNIPIALDHISSHIGGIINTSHCYKTTAINSMLCEDSTNYFLNLAIEIETYIDPMKLKEKLLMIESLMGRIRDDNDKFIARVIDLDISFYTGKNKNSTSSCFIAEDIQRFCHVIVPLADIKPKFMIENSGKNILKVAEELTGLKSPSDFFPKVELDKLPNFNFRANILQNKYHDNIEIDKTTFSSNDKKKVALVTGGASKIGRHITQRLHACDYNIALHYNSHKEIADEEVDRMNVIRHDSAIVVQGDFSKSPQNVCDQILATIVDKWNTLDVIVNNSSIFKETDLLTCSEEEWNNVLNINLSSPFFLVKASLHHLARGHGCVINIGDIHGDRPLKNHSAYSISKSGLIALTKSLAKDLGGHGIRVNGINPGAIFWIDEKVPDAFKQSTLSKTCLNKLGNAKDICDTVEFLIKNSYITGQVINVDGGRTLNQ